MRLFQDFKNNLSKDLLLIDSSRYILQTMYKLCINVIPMSVSCFDLQCLTRLGKMVQRFIDTHFQRSTVRLTFSRLSCALMEVFHVSGIQPHPTNICFISNLLKNFQNSFSASDSSCYSILSPSMSREAISDSSELVIFNILCESNY